MADGDDVQRTREAEAAHAVEMVAGSLDEVLALVPAGPIRDAIRRYGEDERLLGMCLAQRGAREALALRLPDGPLTAERDARDRRIIH